MTRTIVTGETEELQRLWRVLAQIMDSDVEKVVLMGSALKILIDEAIVAEIRADRERRNG